MGLFGFKSKNEKTKERLVAEANSWIDDLKKEKNLKSVSTNIILKQGEEAYIVTESNLYENRGTTYSKSSGHGGAVRIAKGVYIGGSNRSGSSETRQELKLIDKGVLTLTNKRLVFDGNRENRSIPIDKIISVDHYTDSVEISSESRSKSMLFNVPNPYIWFFIFNILIQVPDPHKLGEINLSINS